MFSFGSGVIRLREKLDREKQDKIDVAVTIDDAEEAKKQTLVATSLSVAYFPIRILPRASFLYSLL